MYRKIAWIVLTAIAPRVFADRTEVQNFDDGGYAHPFFTHVFEYDMDCCRMVTRHEQLKGGALYLVPNSDVVRFSAAPGEVVESISITMLDYEGGFVGWLPTSAVVVRGAGGDFVVLHAAQIGIAENVGTDRYAAGFLTGKPIGPIVEVNLQAANEGNSVFPDGVGAYFDDVTAQVLDACVGDLNLDRVVDLADLSGLLAHFGIDDGAEFADGDFDADGDVDLADLGRLLSRFGTACN